MGTGKQIREVRDCDGFNDTVCQAEFRDLGILDRDDVFNSLAGVHDLTVSDHENASDNTGDDKDQKRGTQDLPQAADRLYSGDRADDREHNSRNGDRKAKIYEDRPNRLYPENLLAKCQTEDGTNHNACQQQQRQTVAFWYKEFLFGFHESMLLSFTFFFCFFL